MKNKSLVFLGLTAFIGALIWYLPTSIITPYLSQVDKRLTYQSSSGTLWNGRMNYVKYTNVHIGNIRWSIQPKFLLQGKLGIKLTINNPELTFDGFISLSFNQTVELHKAQFMVTSKWLHQIKKIARVTRLTGDFDGQIEHLLWQTNTQKPPKLTARINWVKGGLLSPIKIDTGNYSADIQPKGSLLRMTLLSQNAPIDVQGEVTLDENWHYQTDISLQPQPDQQSLQQMMAFSMQADQHGTFSVKQSGILPH